MTFTQLFVLIVIEMMVRFCYTLWEIYHQNFYPWKIKIEASFVLRDLYTKDMVN